MRRSFFKSLSALVVLFIPSRLPQLRIMVAGPTSADIKLFLDGVDVSSDVPVSWESKVRAARPGDVLHLTRFARDDRGLVFSEYRMPGKPWATVRSGVYGGPWLLLGMDARLAQESLTARVIA